MVLGPAYSLRHWLGFAGGCRDDEASIYGCAHLLLDHGPLGIHLVFACSEAVNAAEPVNCLGKLPHFLKTTETNQSDMLSCEQHKPVRQKQ